MLKAIKECLKNWLVTHERLYWYIVVGLAVLGFGIITAMGCAKLEKANAADTRQYTVTWGNGSKTFEVADGQYYAYLFWISGSGWKNYMFMTSSEPFDLYDYSDGTYGISSPAGGSMWKTVSKDGGVSYEETYSSYTWQNMYGIHKASSCEVYSNCDIVTRNTGGVIVFSANPLVAEAVYTLDAPYINFQKVVVDNKITDYYFNPHVFDSFYETYTKTSSWKYFGKLNNMDAEKDKEYLLECEFLVQLPTADYVLGQYEAHDLDMHWETNVIKNGADFVHEWNVNKKAPFVEYSFLYTFPLVPDDNGNFTYQMSFDEMELLIKYFNEDFRNEWNEYSDYFRSVLLSYIHVECVTASVETTRDDSVVYGKICTNQFGRGIYDTCIEVIPEIDINTATPEEIDKILSDAVENANNQYIKDLEDRLENLENQVSGNTSVQMGFGNLEGSDLWSGFVGLTQGIGGMAPAVQSLSVLTGSVLAFLPFQMSGIMATTMLAICVIAIVKAIRG